MKSEANEPVSVNGTANVSRRSAPSKRRTQKANNAATKNSNVIDNTKDIISKTSSEDHPHYQRTDQYDAENTNALQGMYHEIITRVGEDPEREGLVKTPLRVAKAMQYITQGYEMDAHEIVRGAMFEEPASEMIIVKDIELYSLCEHHMLPFFGKAHVAYIPNGRIVGLSKIARVVDVFARRLQVQERLTHQVLECLRDTLDPLGVAVVIEAKHLCMMMRGVQKQNSSTTTSAFFGEFRNQETRNEFISLVSAKLS